MGYVEASGRRNGVEIWDDRYEFDGETFSEATFEKADFFHVEQIGSFVYRVERFNSRRHFLVHSDVSAYTYSGNLRSSFAYCTCYRGRRARGKIVCCEHVAAVYLYHCEQEEL